jgi:phage regulator Rha-like protein
MLKVIERNDSRVLTSAQLAEAFETDMSKIRYNFNYNKSRYEEGKHYLVVKGEELKDFKTECEIHTELKHAHTIYLWTEKGAFLHAKSLGTDKAWNAYSQLVDEYFKKVEEAKQVQRQQSDLTGLSPQLQFMIQMEQRHNALEAKFTLHETNQKEIKDAVSTLTENLVAAPDHTKVVSLINEYARWTRLGHNEVYNKVYDLLKSAHGVDVRQRVSNEREKVQREHNNKTGKFYSESTLKGRVNGIDIMVRLGCLDKFHGILSGLLAKEKIRNTLSLVK